MFGKDKSVKFLDGVSDRFMDAANFRIIQKAGTRGQSFALNPYWYHLRNESILQSNCVAAFEQLHPNILFFHVPNEGKRSPFEQFEAKMLGIKNGIPDFFCPHPSKGYNGLVIEFKVKPNKLTDSQKEMLDKLKNDCGFKTAVCYSFAEFESIVTDYF